MKTYSAKPSEVEKKWLIVDAKDLVLGRMAAEISKVLRGKHKPTYTPHIDCGDNVIVINAEKVHLTGNKLEDKKYYRHTGHPGGIREINVRKTLEGKKPEDVVRKAVQRMITRGKLGRKQMTNLFIYAGSEHNHQAQKPVKFDIGAMNPKNNKERKEVSK